jgi:hypothetical protein
MALDDIIYRKSLGLFTGCLSRVQQCSKCVGFPPHIGGSEGRYHPSGNSRAGEGCFEQDIEVF